MTTISRRHPRRFRRSRPVATLGARRAAPRPPPVRRCCAAPSDAVIDTELDAAWLDDGRAIGIVTLGSSTCVPMAGEPTYDAATSTLTVELTDPDGEACTRDLVPRATLVRAARGRRPDQGPRDRGDRHLRRRHRPRRRPGADRRRRRADRVPAERRLVRRRAAFVILTWGSSSCAPVLEDVEATGPAEVTVTFATPAADQVCTMDMAPRVTVAAVRTSRRTRDVQLILTGGEFDNVKTPHRRRLTLGHEGSGCRGIRSPLFLGGRGAASRVACAAARRVRCGGRRSGVARVVGCGAPGVASVAGVRGADYAGATLARGRGVGAIESAASGVESGDCSTDEALSRGEVGPRRAVSARCAVRLCPMPWGMPSAWRRRCGSVCPARACERRDLSGRSVRST